MRRQPEIIATDATDEYLRLDLRVPADLAQFDGHFPGTPLLPGVAQIDWAVNCARDLLQQRGRFTALRNVKFTRVISPGAELTLEMRHIPHSGAVSFRYTQAGVPCSSGRIEFADD